MSAWRVYLLTLAVIHSEAICGYKVPCRRYHQYRRFDLYYREPVHEVKL